MRIVIAMSLIAVVSAGCDKSKDADEQKTAVTAPAPAGEGATKDKVPEQVAPAVPADGEWTRYENAENGFSVLVPAGVKPEEMDLDRSAEGMVGKGYQFALSADAIGQLMYLRYDGPEEYDIDKGLDGAVNGAIEAMSSKMTDYKKVEVNGKTARTFSFEGSAQGYSFVGMGVAIGSSGKEIKAAMSLYQKGSTVSPAKADKFVKSFEIK